MMMLGISPRAGWLSIVSAMHGLVKRAANEEFAERDFIDESCSDNRLDDPVRPELRKRLTLKEHTFQDGYH